MAFTDWDQYTSGTFTINHNTSSIVVGTGSIEIASSSGNDVVASVVASDSSGMTKGLIDGKFRTILHYVGSTGSGAQGNNIGISVMHSADDITTSGSCYSLIWHFSDNLAIEDLRLAKHTAGLTSTSITTLDQNDSFGKVSGNTWTFELEWIASKQTELGGTLLTARVGTATDFSDLAVEFQYVDLTGDSPLTTSAAEGLFHRYGSSTTAFQRTMYFDQTTLFSLS